MTIICTRCFDHCTYGVEWKSWEVEYQHWDEYAMAWLWKMTFQLELIDCDCLFSRDGPANFPNSPSIRPAGALADKHIVSCSVNFLDDQPIRSPEVESQVGERKWQHLGDIWVSWGAIACTNCVLVNDGCLDLAVKVWLDETGLARNIWWRSTCGMSRQILIFGIVL